MPKSSQKMREESLPCHIFDNLSNLEQTIAMYHVPTRGGLVAAPNAAAAAEPQ
jgi:hypothetical protein